MEFLLINHPLDCPICDQGGECQLQDLAVGYGKSASRYSEEKRVVFHKNVGPLISMEEMTRCIHCTRCVRFGQEVAGVMELGMLGRGEHSEITSFVGKTVDSELSGNMIDLCPVGALTSKPFRYSARTWELSRRKSVSPHDSVGANLVVQVKNNRVMRVLPFENEAINECWISDKDRFSYEALNSPERLTQPMLKQGGKWVETDWQTALEYVAKGLKGIKADHGANAHRRARLAPHSTVEELYPAEAARASASARLTSTSVCVRADFSAPVERRAVARHDDRGSVERRRRVGHRLVPAPRSSAVRRASASGREERREAHVRARHQRRLADAGRASRGRGAVGVARRAGRHRRGGCRKRSGVALPEAFAGTRSLGRLPRQVAASLSAGESRVVLLGNGAVQHPRLRADSCRGAVDRGRTGATLGFLTEAANTVGAHLVERAAGRRRPERPRSVRAAAQGLRAAERRARIRHGESGAGAAPR